MLEGDVSNDNCELSFISLLPKKNSIPEDALSFKLQYSANLNLHELDLPNEDETAAHKYLNKLIAIGMKYKNLTVGKEELRISRVYITKQFDSRKLKNNMLCFQQVKNDCEKLKVTKARITENRSIRESLLKNNEVENICNSFDHCY